MLQTASASRAGCLGFVEAAPKGLSQDAPEGGHTDARLRNLLPICILGDCVIDSPVCGMVALHKGARTKRR